MIYVCVCVCERERDMYTERLSLFIILLEDGRGATTRF